MYHPERKNRYISNSVRKESVVKDLIYKFEKITSYEEDLERDLCDFSVGEILDFYRLCYSSSLETIMVINNTYANYTDFCIQNGLVKDSMNHYREINNEMIAECLNKNLGNKKIVTREEVENIVKSLANPGDAFIILALFEGICGLKYCDLFYANISQFEGNIMHCYSGRDVVVSDLLKELAIKATDTYEYYNYSDIENYSNKMYDLDDDNIVKRLNNAKKDGTVTDGIMLQRIKMRIIRAREATGFECIGSKSLLASGRIDMIKKIMKREPDLSVEEVINKYYEEISDRYGKLSSIPRFILQYKDILMA